MAAGEFELIDWIRRQAATSPRVPLGIGDDAAVVRFTPGARCLATVDTLVEGVHFTFPEASPYQVGRKALAVNLSDIAAMGGSPVAALVSLALPQGRGEEFVRELYGGLIDLAREFDVVLAGGDTNSSPAGFTISVTVLGETLHAPILRSGARPGDAVFVTGTLGGSLAGRHFSFVPRTREARALRDLVEVHAMIDVSDGLAADLHHILDESGVGAVLQADAIPISDEARAAGDGRSPLDHALGDGEDFELLLTVSDQDAARLLTSPPAGIPLTRIGTITPGPGALLEAADGSRRPLERLGWRHAL